MQGEIKLQEHEDSILFDEVDGYGVAQINFILCLTPVNE